MQTYKLQSYYQKSNRFILVDPTTKRQRFVTPEELGKLMGLNLVLDKQTKLYMGMRRNG